MTIQAISIKIMLVYLVSFSFLISFVQCLPFALPCAGDSGCTADRYRLMRIYAIADMDKKSALPDGKTFISYLREGVLKINENLDDPRKSTAEVTWDRTRGIKSGVSYKGRGMELSTLTKFNDKLYSCDDKSGIVYQLPTATPSNIIEPIKWITLADGDGSDPGQRFKCEWSTVKDDQLWIGGQGVRKKNNNEKWVKVVTPTGQVKHLDWSQKYSKIMESVGISEPGYITHEAVNWNPRTLKWIFLPRRVSSVKYNPDNDGHSSSNIVIIADPTFTNIQVKHIGNFDDIRGFSAFKFIPNTRTPNLIVALKTVEIEELPDIFATYAVVLDLNTNHTLMNENKFDDKKYEGIEFVRRK